VPNVPLLEPAAASQQVAEVYEDFQRRMGFPAPPNFIKTQGHSLAAARGTWGLVQNVLVGGILPRTLKEMMFSAISRDRECRYCEAAHLACCRMLGVDEATLKQLVEDAGGLTPTKVRDIIAFGRKCARDPQSLGEADFQSLRQHGLSQSEIVEVIAMAGLAVYANTIADATALSADKMFSDL
jgi:uncharacterized peroxidase-related enzyme